MSRRNPSRIPGKILFVFCIVAIGNQSAAADNGDKSWLNSTRFDDSQGDGTARQ